MFGFLIKKSFFDTWDNLLAFLLLNLGFILCLAVLLLLPSAAPEGSFYTALLLAVPGFLLIHIYTGAVSSLIFEISEYRSLKLSAIKESIKLTVKASLFFALLNTILLTIFFIAWSFYSSGASFTSMLGAGVIFWLALVWFLTGQQFFPVFIRMKGSLLKSLKKSILISLDNPVFSIFELLMSVLLFAVSVVTLLFLPGITGILILQHNALKLRLYKYDWLEENPEVKKIPWDILLKEDKEKLGHRSLKGMIFPWKD